MRPVIFVEAKFEIRQKSGPELKVRSSKLLEYA